MQCPPEDRIVYVGRSNQISPSLSQYIWRKVENLEDIPPNTFFRAIIVSSEFSSPVNLSWIRRAYSESFIVVLDPQAADRPHFRLECFDAGANMVAHDEVTLSETLHEAVLPAGRDGGRYICPYCGLRGLSEREIWYHCPTYHINWPNDVFVTDNCPICQHTLHEPLQVHIHEKHGPMMVSLYEDEKSSGVTQLYNFSLVICRHPRTGKFLLCQEFANQGFWCPGGAVDDGEVITTAALRETYEEAGIHVELKGILGIEYHPIGKSRHSKNGLVRMRTIFYAEPSQLHGLDQVPKSRPDFESAGACWASYEEIQHLRLRGNEPRKWAKYLVEGGDIYPMKLLSEKSS